MGYSDQKYYSRDLDVAKPSTITGTATASSGTNNVATGIVIRNFTRPAKISGAEVLVTTAATASTALSLALLNGTTTFCVIPTGLSTAGVTVVGTITNTAVVTTATVTNTLPNGSTQVGTVISTTDYRNFAAGAAPTINVIGTATASGNSVGTHELWLEASELFS